MNEKSIDSVQTFSVGNASLKAFIKWIPHILRWVIVFYTTYYSFFFYWTIYSTWMTEEQVENQLVAFRNSHRRCSARKGVLRNFAKFTGKHLCQSLFFVLSPETLLKKRLWHRCFPMNFCVKNTFFTEHLWTTASKLSSLLEWLKKKWYSRIISVFVLCL